jgi:outer membrane protein TolC
MNENQKLKSLLILVFTFLPTCVSFADSLSLHSSIEIALQNNLDLKSEQFSLSKSKTDFNKAKKEEFYPKIEADLTGGSSKKTQWLKDEEGKEYKQTTKTKEKPTIEINSEIARPHPLGGKLKLNLKVIEAFNTESSDGWELKLDSEESLSGYRRNNLKDPLYEEKLQLQIANLNQEEKINGIIYKVINAYSGLKRFDSNLAIKQKELEDLQNNLEISKFKLEKGLIPEMDILQTELSSFYAAMAAI